MFTNCFIIELAVLSSRPDGVDLVSPLTKPEEGGVSNIQDKWSQRDPSYFFLVVISLDLTWTVDTKEFGYQGGLYRRLRTREDLKYNKDQSAGVKMTKKPSVTEPVVQGADSGNTQVSDIGGLSIQIQGDKC